MRELTKSCKGLEQAARGDPGILATRVAAVQPVHVHDALHEPDAHGMMLEFIYSLLI